MNEIASRYSLALYTLALENDLAESWQEEVKELSDLLKENKQFIKILGSTFYSFNEREKIIDDTLIGVSKDILSLIKIIVRNNRVDLIFDVFSSFNTYCNEYRGVKEGIVYSSIPLQKDLLIQIQEKLSKFENCKIELISKIDPSLIGGVKVTIQDRVYDGSIKHKLEDLKNSLLKQESKL